MLRQAFISLVGTFAVLLPFLATAAVDLPPSITIDPGKVEPPCKFNLPKWRDAQVVEGVQIQESRRCLPDNPDLIAAVVKGTNNISMETLMETHLSVDSVIKKDDLDGDGDPDVIIIKLEVFELNGHTPDFAGLSTTYDIAPGVQPAMWVFAPKTRGMSTQSFISNEANTTLRAPSPVIRVEQDDIVWLQLENSHYFPHTIHLHGVDHPYVDSSGEGNDGVPQTSDKVVMPGSAKTYEFKPRVPGTFVYHCHVQAHVHIGMGLIGMLVVEENKPNNWVQTLNVGAGQVRHPSKGVLADYDSEYDMHYHALDKELGDIVKEFNDPRLVARKMNREYDLQDATDEYHLLNGLSFPFTLRESLIVAEPDQNIKMRIFNSSGEMFAMHTHGHKATITHYDGVEHNPIAQITRDIYDLAPAQRNDLKISTKNDGFHSYGEGIWIFHDHREKGITTDGMNPGGGVSALVYKSYLNENGMPKVQGSDITPLFTQAFHSRQYPVWQDFDEWNSLGEPEEVEDEDLGDAFVVPPPKDKNKKTVAATLIATTDATPVVNFMKGLGAALVVFLLYAFRGKLTGVLSLFGKKGGRKDA